MPWQQILLLSMPNAAIAFTVTEVLRAIAELDEGEERVSWGVGIVRVLL